MSDLTEIKTETNLQGTLVSTLSTTGLSVQVQFFDNKTGATRTPQSDTLLFTIDQDNAQAETIKASSHSTVSGITTITIAANGRNIPKFGVAAGSGTGLSHVVGAAIGCVNVARPLNKIGEQLDTKADLSGATFTGPVGFSGATNRGITVQRLTTAQRDALVAPPDGTEIYNLDIGMYQDRTAGSWLDRASGGTFPDASETVAGKVELATNAEMGTGTSIGGTGARLVPPNDQLVKTSSGAGDANKIAVLGNAGQYATGFIPTGTDDTKILKSVLSAKGSIVGATAAATPADVPVGSNNQVLIADSAQANGVKWGSTPLTSNNFRNGLASRAGDTASGSQAIAHGLGKAPTRIDFTVVSILEDTKYTGHSWGTWDASGQNLVYSMVSSNVDNLKRGNKTSSVIYLERITGTDSQTAVVSSVDATNINLTWTKTGSGVSATDMDILFKVEG